MRCVQGMSVTAETEEGLRRTNTTSMFTCSVKDFGLTLNPELNSIKPTQWQKTKPSSAWTITSRRGWGDRILETERWSSERFWELSALVWWNAEEQNGRRRRQEEMISILYWLVRTRNSSSPSSSRSLKTQSHWSYTSGQDINSGCFVLMLLWILVFTVSFVSDVSPFSRKVLYVDFI